MTTALKTIAKEKFLAFVARKQLRLTAQRQSIIDVVFSTDEHFTADQLFEWSKKRDSSVSRATVYRTLPLLTESGLVREMDFGKVEKYYDPNYAEHPHHNHVICLDCKKIFEFDNDKLARLETEISRQMGFTVASNRLQIMARCDDLKKTGICNKTVESAMAKRK